ncbi:MAG TPA: GGDEF domain-containing protein [Nitrospirota bacterium]|nr:GGDEF domain-containing protein [Nitrospirota bacterium]
MEHNDIYETLLENLEEGVCVVDRDWRVTSWNKGAERITGYAASDVVGRLCSESVLVHTDKHGALLCNSVCSLDKSEFARQQQPSEVFILHKDGHRVPVLTHIVLIQNTSGAVEGGIEIFTDLSAESAALERLADVEKMAFIDSLTGLANRRFAEITLKARLEELQRYGWGFSVVFIDIDNFKDINDRYGHDVGDDVLRTVAKTLQNSVRSFDLVSRWGGEEYVAIIANVDAEKLVSMANRCRSLVQQSVHAGSAARVTISLGATIARLGDTEETLIKRADELMYKSKASGKNCVTMEQ